MLTAFQPFYLAEGKLDGYFDSIRPEDLVTDLEVQLPTRPMFLLHDLGRYSDKEQIDCSQYSVGVVFMVDD